MMSLMNYLLNCLESMSRSYRDAHFSPIRRNILNISPEHQKVTSCKTVNSPFPEGVKAENMILQQGTWRSGHSGLCPGLPGPPLSFLVPHSQLLCSFDSKGQQRSHREPNSLALHSDKLRGVIYLPGLLCGVRLRL